MVAGDVHGGHRLSVGTVRRYWGPDWDEYVAYCKGLLITMLIAVLVGVLAGWLIGWWLA